MPEDVVRDLQEPVDLLNSGLIEIELRDDVMAFTLVLHGIGKPALTPRCDLLDLASIGLDQLADLLDLLLNRVIVKLWPDEVHQLIRRQTAATFLWICSEYDLPRWHRSRKASLSVTKEKRPPDGDRYGGKPLGLLLDLTRLNFARPLAGRRA